MLLGLFIQWGWDSGVAVDEESQDSANGPGRAAVLSPVLLVVIYVIVADSVGLSRRSFPGLFARPREVTARALAADAGGG